MAFCIRESDPFIGRITLYFIPNGHFVAAKKTVSEREFLDEVRRYLDRKNPGVTTVPAAVARPTEERGENEHRSPLGEPRSVRLKKRAAASG